MAQARQFGDNYIKMSVTDSCNQLHFNTDLVLNLVVVLSALAGFTSLRARRLEFSPATMNVVPGYFHTKIEEK